MKAQSGRGVMLAALFAVAALLLSGCWWIQQESPDATATGLRCDTPAVWTDDERRECERLRFGRLVEEAREVSVEGQTPQRADDSAAFADWHENVVRASRDLPVAKSYDADSDSPEFCPVFVGDMLTPVSRAASDNRMVVTITYHSGVRAESACADGTELLMWTIDFAALQGLFDEMVEHARKNPPINSPYFAVTKVTKAEVAMTEEGEEVSPWGATCFVQPANRLELLDTYPYPLGGALQAEGPVAETRLARNGSSLNDPDGSCADGAIVLVDAEYFEYAPH